MNTLVFQSPNEPDISSRCNELLAMADRCKIVTDKDAENAADLIKFIKSQTKKAEEERTSLVKPFNDGVKAINARFKKYMEPLEKAEVMVKRELLSFEQEKRRLAAIEAERIRKQEEEARLAAAAAAQDKGNAELADTILDAMPAVVAPATSPVRGNYGATASVRKTWTYEVTDLHQLANTRPDLVVPNDKLIRDLVREGIRELPGVRIYQEESLQVR